MANNVKLRVDDTVIHVIKNDAVIFQYDYMDLYNLWLKYIDYIPEEPDDDKEPEGYAISVQENELAVALLEGSDQGGILGIIDMSTGELIHTQEAAYYIAGITTEDKVITLHLVHHYGVFPYFTIQIKAKGRIDFSECDDYFKVPQELALDVDDSYSLSLDGDCLLIENTNGSAQKVNIQEYLHKKQK